MEGTHIARRTLMAVFFCALCVFAVLSCTSLGSQQGNTGNGASEVTRDEKDAADNGGVVNAVTDCRADPTTERDSSSAIEQCIDLVMQDGGGTVEVPAGRYLLSEPIDLDNSDRLGVRIEGAGTKTSGTHLLVEGDAGIIADQGSLEPITGPTFERFHMVARNEEADLIRLGAVNHGHFEQLWLEGGRYGVVIDSKRRAYGDESDASYHEFYDVRLRDQRIGLYNVERGGFLFVGGHIVLVRSDDVGIRIEGGGYQYRVVGTRIDGGFNDGKGIGVGIEVEDANHLQTSAVQIESANIGYHIISGDQNELDGFVANNGNDMYGVLIEEGARNTIVDTLQFSRPDTPNALVNRSESTRRVVTEPLPSSP